jgi:hypothetical protein
MYDALTRRTRHLARVAPSRPRRSKTKKLSLTPAPPLTHLPPPPLLAGVAPPASAAPPCRCRPSSRRRLTCRRRPFSQCRFTCQHCLSLLVSCQLPTSAAPLCRRRGESMCVLLSPGPYGAGTNWFLCLSLSTSLDQSFLYCVMPPNAHG